MLVVLFVDNIFLVKSNMVLFVDFLVLVFSILNVFVIFVGMKEKEDIK